MAGLFRDALRWIFRRVVRIYFREIETAGVLPEPQVGGRVFLANHVNALVDPILVLTAAPCPVSPVAKSTLWKVPGLSWLLDAVEAVPITRRRDDPTKAAGSNDAIFDQVAASLSNGQNILIFPEGTSHNEPRLLEVKTGAARMLARAFERGGKALTFQAVALEFDARDKFRSRCLILYGPVRHVDAVAGEAQDLVSEITRILREDLSELLVEGATWPERLLITRVAEMLANEAGDPTMENWNAIGRKVEAARKALGDAGEDEVRAIETAVTRYHRLLADEGLADHQLTLGDAPSPKLGRAAALLLLLPLALFGTVAYALPYRVPRLVARGVKDADEVSTKKLAAGLLAYPLFGAGLAIAAFAFLPAEAAAAVAVMLLASPFAALFWLDAARDLGRALRFRRRKDALAELRAARAEAMALVQATRDRLGIA